MEVGVPYTKFSSDMLTENDSALTVNVWFLTFMEHTPHTERGKDVEDTN